MESSATVNALQAPWPAITRATVQPQVAFVPLGTTQLGDQGVYCAHLGRTVRGLAPLHAFLAPATAHQQQGRHHVRVNRITSRRSCRRRRL